MQLHEKSRFKTPVILRPTGLLKIVFSCNFQSCDRCASFCRWKHPEGRPTTPVARRNHRLTPEVRHPPEKSRVQLLHSELYLKWTRLVSRDFFKFYPLQTMYIDRYVTSRRGSRRRDGASIVATSLQCRSYGIGPLDRR